MDVEQKPLSAMIPTRFVGVCEFCQQELDIRQEGTHQYTAGWVMIREGGGGHGISLPQRYRRWAHRHCLERAVKGHINQDGLF